MAAAGYIWAQDAQEQLTPAAQNHIASHRHWLDECEHPHPKIGFCTKLCGFKIDDVDEEEEEDLTFVKLLPRTGKQRREVQKLVEEDMALSEEAAFVSCSLFSFFKQKLGGADFRRRNTSFAIDDASPTSIFSSSSDSPAPESDRGMIRSGTRSSSTSPGTPSKPSRTSTAGAWSTATSILATSSTSRT